MANSTPKKYGIWCIRSGASIFGHREAWAKDEYGQVLLFTTRPKAKKQADNWNWDTSYNVRYEAKEYQS